MVTMMTKTKRVKLIICCILIFVALITIALTTLSLTKISYAINLNSPSRIIVYNNSENTNIVFEQNDTEYIKIYNLILDGYKQSTLKALLSRELNKDTKIVKNAVTDIKFDGIKINFVYDLPQSAKCKNKLYQHNNEVYWYQNLIFDVSSANNFNYQQVAIIPPSSASDYVNPNTYYLHYMAYANFSKLHNYVANLF